MGQGPAMESHIPSARTWDPRVYPTWLLARSGLTRPQLRGLVEAGRLNRLRRGWYALSDADSQVTLAVASGGCLSCVSALRWYGVWVPTTKQVHIRAYRHHSPPDPSVALQCGNSHAMPAPAAAVDPILVALSVAWQCLDNEERVIVLDSMLNLGLATRRELADTLSGRDLAVELLAKCDRSESGTETVTRLRLRARQIRVRPQTWIAGVGRVDLLIGQRLVIECDSRMHHTDQGAYQRDRDRDRTLHSRGYLVIRLTYHDVMNRWNEVETDILAIIRRREHRQFPGGEAPRQAS